MWTAAVAQRLQLPGSQSITWAANSELLAIVGSGGHKIFNTVTQTWLETATACKGLVAWSPCTWGTPHLLRYGRGVCVLLIKQAHQGEGAYRLCGMHTGCCGASLAS